MYLSLLTPRPGHLREAIHTWLEGAYSQHQFLWQLFPQIPRGERPFLFRRDEEAGAPRFYLLSQLAPTGPCPGWELDTRAYAPRLEAGLRLRFALRANPTVARTGPGGPDTRGLRHDVVMNEKMRHLRNRGLAHWRDWRKPSEGPDPDPRPPVAELLLPTCAPWLEKQSKARGFAVDPQALAVDAYEQHVLHRPLAEKDEKDEKDEKGEKGEKGQKGKKDTKDDEDKKNGPIRFSSVDFTGELTVTDPEAFRKTLHGGLGRAKAFGCGLLLIHPA